MIQWSSAVRHSLLTGVSSFRNVTNYSMGVEYAVVASEKVKLYPRAGVRLFHAPLDVVAREDQLALAVAGWTFQDRPEPTGEHAGARLVH